MFVVVNHKYIGAVMLINSLSVLIPNACQNSIICYVKRSGYLAPWLKYGTQGSIGQYLLSQLSPSFRAGLGLEYGQDISKVLEEQEESRR